MIDPLRRDHFARWNLLITVGTSLVVGTIVMRRLLLHAFIGSEGRLDHQNPEREDDQCNSQGRNRLTKQWEPVKDREPDLSSVIGKIEKRGHHSIRIEWWPLIFSWKVTGWPGLAREVPVRAMNRLRVVFMVSFCEAVAVPSGRSPHLPAGSCRSREGHPEGAGVSCNTRDRRCRWSRTRQSGRHRQ